MTPPPPPERTSLVIPFEGWGMLRLPTDPDPSDELRGVSGYTFAFGDEPDLDRILRFQPPPHLARSQGPELGVKVKGAVRTDGVKVPALDDARVNLLGKPMLENRNWTLTLPGFEPIVPFEIQVAGDGARLQRRAPLDPKNPDQPVWQTSDELLALQGARGMEFEPATVGEATGIWDSRRMTIDRLAALEAQRAEAIECGVANAKIAVLDGRINELRYSVANPTDRRVLVRSFVERFGFLLAGRADAIADSPEQLGGTLDATSPWRIDFWLGAWDPDLMCLYVKGALVVPYERPTKERTGPVSLHADKMRFNRDAGIVATAATAGPDAPAQLGISPAELEALQNAMQGKVVVPGMAQYAHARLGNPVYPGAFDPKIILYCAVPGDVRVALDAARSFGLTPTCRSGGHSSAGYSVNDSMVIDVSLMNHVAVDPNAKRAVVGAGANIGQLNATLGIYGLHVPGGTCDEVGVAGHMMGGGYGFTSRQYGMNCDRVVAVTMMLADGAVIEASKDSNPDLLWAVRGGTGNQFGVLLDITYDLVELYELWGFFLRWNAADAPAVLAALQDGYMGQDPLRDRIGYLAAYSTFAAGPGLAVFGTFNGSAKEGREALADLRAIGFSASTFDKTDTYANLNDALLALLPGIPDPPAGKNVYEAKQAAYVDKPLGMDGWTEVVNYFETAPNAIDIVAIEPYGGAISSYPVGDSAFIHRAVDMDFFVDSFWIGEPTGPERATAENWLRGYVELVEPWCNGHVYQNYPARGQADYRHAYWGEAFSRLLEIKQKYDPDDLFAFEQSISPEPQ